ncbi:MAG TPA: type II toxin-antitoxin system RelE/ParE family toxin [Planctomycetota bacterium]|jgi:addiction module RelE/StbE family toxin
MGAFNVVLKPSAVADLDRLRKFDSTAILDAIQMLANEPTRESKSRIKKLRGEQQAEYRLRVGHYRVFYTVDEQEERVSVLRVLHKAQTNQFYEET